MGKERVRVAKATGRLYTPERTVNYESRFALAAQTAMEGRPLIEGPVSMDLSIHVPIPESWPKKRKEMALAGSLWPTKKPDSSNVLKAVEDAFNLVVWVDDAQVVKHSIAKQYSLAPRVDVWVRAIDEEVFG
jgi:Holliday junction resolvase RusA-like endonuclease